MGIFESQLGATIDWIRLLSLLFADSSWANFKSSDLTSHSLLIGHISIDQPRELDLRADRNGDIAPY